MQFKSSNVEYYQLGQYMSLESVHICKCIYLHQSLLFQELQICNSSISDSKSSKLFNYPICFEEIERDNASNNQHSSHLEINKLDSSF